MDEKLRCGKMSAAQKSALIELIKSNSELISGKFTSTFTHKKAQQLWLQISETLNAIPGGQKNWKQWRKTWQDLQTKTKSKSSKLIKDHGRTGGGGPNVEILTEDEDKVLSMMSPVEIIGDSNIKESHAMFVDNFEDIENVEITFEPAASSSITEENKSQTNNQQMHPTNEDLLPPINLNKKRKTRAAAQRLTESVVATQKLAEIMKKKMK